MPGRPELAGFADAAAGDDCFAGASDDEVLGVVCGWDRVEAHAAARKHAAVAEVIRRRPAAGYRLAGRARMPGAWDEFTASELCAVLAVSRWDADAMLALAHDLEVKLPGTKAAFLDGILYARTKPRSSPGPSPCWTRLRRGRRRRWCWAGPGG